MMPPCTHLRESRANRISGNSYPGNLSVMGPNFCTTRVNPVLVPTSLRMVMSL